MSGDVRLKKIYTYYKIMDKKSLDRPQIIEFDGLCGILEYKLTDGSFEERWFWKADSEFRFDEPVSTEDVDNLRLTLQPEQDYKSFLLPYGLVWQRTTRENVNKSIITGFDAHFDPEKEFVYINEDLAERMQITRSSIVKIENVYFIPFPETTDKFITQLGGFDLQKHQKAIRNKVRNGTNFKLLQHGMGTGKTISGLAIMEELLMRNRVNRFLVVVPDALLAEWTNEIHEQGYSHINKFLHFKTYSDIFTGNIEVDAQTGILFDEMHRLLMQMNTVVESRISLQRTKIDQGNILLGKDYRDMYNAFQNITKGGAMFGLTGTPIFSDIYDVAFLINLFSRCESGFDSYPSNKFDFYENCMEIDQGRLKLLQTYQMLSTDLGGSKDGKTETVTDNFIDLQYMIKPFLNGLVPLFLSKATEGLVGAPVLFSLSLGNMLYFMKDIKVKGIQSYWPPKMDEPGPQMNHLIDFNVGDVLEPFQHKFTPGDALSTGTSNVINTLSGYAMSKFSNWFKNARDNWIMHARIFKQVKNILPIVNYVDYFDVRDEHRNKENGVARFPNTIYKTVRVSLDIYSIRMHMLRQRDEILKWGSHKDVSILANLRAIYGVSDDFQNVNVYLQIREIDNGKVLTDLDAVGGLSKIDDLIRKAVGLDDMNISICEKCSENGVDGVTLLEVKMPGSMQLLFASHIAFLTQDFSLTADRGCNRAKYIENDKVRYMKPIYEIYGCTRVNDTDEYCTPWVRYIMFPQEFTNLERKNIIQQLNEDKFFGLKDKVQELPSGKLKLVFKTVKSAEIFHKMFKSDLHAKTPLQILLGENDTTQRTPITIDEAKVTIKNIMSHMTDSITPVDLKRIPSLPCPQRKKYPYPNKFYALFYNFLLDGDLTQHAVRNGEYNAGDLVIDMPTLDRTKPHKTTIVDVREPEEFQVNLIDEKDSGIFYTIPSPENQILDEPPENQLLEEEEEEPPPLEEPQYSAVTGQLAVPDAGINKLFAKTDDHKGVSRPKIKGLKKSKTFYDYNISPLCAVYSQFINEDGGLLTLRDFLLRQNLSDRNRTVYMYRGKNFWTVADHIGLHKRNGPNSSKPLVWPKDFKRVPKSQVKTIDYVFSVLGVPDKNLQYMDENDEIYDKYMEKIKSEPTLDIKDVRIDKHRELIKSLKLKGMKDEYGKIWDNKNDKNAASFEGERITMEEWDLLKKPFKNDPHNAKKLKGIDLGDGRRVQLSLILINRQATEGLSLANLRQIHVLEPIEDAGQFHQVIARGARTGSHGQCEDKGTVIKERTQQVILDKYCSNMYVQAITWYSFIPQQHGFIGVYKLPLTTFNTFASIMREFAETHLYAESWDIEKNDLYGFNRAQYVIRKYWGKYIMDKFIKRGKDNLLRFYEQGQQWMFNYDIDDENEVFEMETFKLKTKYRTFDNKSYEKLQDMMQDIMKTTLFHIDFFETNDDLAAKLFVKSNLQIQMYEKINKVISCGVYSEKEDDDMNTCRSKYPDFRDAEFEYLDCNRGVSKEKFKDKYRGLPLEDPQYQILDEVKHDKTTKKIRPYAFMARDVGKSCKIMDGRVKIDDMIIHKARVHPKYKILKGEIISVEPFENGNVVIKGTFQGEVDEETKGIREKAWNYVTSGMLPKDKYMTVKNTVIIHNSKERYFSTMIDMDIHMNSFDNVTLYEYMPPSMRVNFDDFDGFSTTEKQKKNKQKVRDQTIIFPFGIMKDKRKN